jgi:hypothetical protein
MNEKYRRYIDFIADNIDKPYSRSMDAYGLTDAEKKLVLSKIYDDVISIRITNGNNLSLEILDSFGSQENHTGWWCKNEFNEDGKAIYSENSDGFWVKREFDGSRMVYCEYSTGDIVDRR